MFAPPKMILIILLVVAAWFITRWINRPARPPGRHAGRPQRPAGPRSQGRAQARQQAAIEAEDLVRCGVCGSYVALTAAGCGKPGCPRPR